MAACDIVIDLESALDAAKLTQTQAAALALVYGRDMTLVDAGRTLGCSKQAISQSIEGAAERIAAVYERWEYGAVTVTLNAEEVGA